MTVTIDNAVKHLPAEYYTKCFSTAAKSRQPSAIRSLIPLEKTPGVISLLAGKPNTSTFPFTSLQLTARSPDWTTEETLKIEGGDLHEALQYTATPGIPRLLEWLTGLQENSHGRKQGEGWRVSLGSGSQDVVCKAAVALFNPGDSLLIESPVYAGVIPLFKSLGCNLIEVETDAEGMKSSSVREILENWPADQPKPKALYTVPYGCNPTGMTVTLHRKREILALAVEHDLLILEDDPYFYLYFGKAPRPPSYFALELEQPQVGRVIRFDSFSKILSAGLRIGFASGPASILDAMDRHTSSANLQVSSFTQAVTYVLVNSWGYEGFKKHTENASNFYREKRDVFEAAMKRHLDGLAEWVAPEAGMFFWFKLLLTDDDSEGDSADLIRTKALENGVLALPGTAFLPDGRRSAYVRTSFSLNPEEEIDEALKRLGKTILQARVESSKG